MNTYLLVYRHPHDYAGTPDTFAAWEAWFSELGVALVDLGNPVLGDRSTCGPSGDSQPLGGHSIVIAEDLEAATRLANGCPVSTDGGAVEVGRLTPVPGRRHPARTF